MTKKYPWFGPVGLDIFTGICIAFIGFYVKSTLLSSYISVIYVFSTILPGIFMTGHARKMSLGSSPDKKLFLSFCALTLIVNFALTLLFIIEYKKNTYGLVYNTLGAIFFSVASLCQSLSISWFYVFKNKLYFLKVKMIASIIRLAGVWLALMNKEIAFILIATSLSQISDATFAFMQIKLTNSPSKSSEETITTLFYGFSQGFSRSTLSTVKIMLEHFIGAFLSSLLLFEQLFSGVSGIYERYFLNSKINNKKLSVIFIAWVFIVLFFYLIYYNETPGTLKFNLLLGLMSSLVIVPVYYMYFVIRVKGLLAVAKILTSASSFSLILCLVNFLWFHENFIYGICYMILPILQFFMYKNLISKL